MSDSDDSAGASHALSPSDVRQLRWELGILSEDDLAAVLGIEVRTLRNWRTKRQGPPWIKAGVILYRRTSVMAWLAAGRALARRGPTGMRFSFTHSHTFPGSRASVQRVRKFTAVWSKHTLR